VVTRIFVLLGSRDGKDEGEVGSHHNQQSTQHGRSPMPMSTQTPTHVKGSAAKEAPGAVASGGSQHGTKAISLFRSRRESGNLTHNL
jgi:hypothetical protein